MRWLVSARNLIAHRVSVANQLREHLKRVFPGALGLFEDLDSAISLKFLTRFDCQDRADWLTSTRLGAWLKSVRYRNMALQRTLTVEQFKEKVVEVKAELADFLNLIQITGALNFHLHPVGFILAQHEIRSRAPQLAALKDAAFDDA